MAVTFESYERRIDQIKPVMEKYGIKDFEDALKICTDKGFNPFSLHISNASSNSLIPYFSITGFI